MIEAKELTKIFEGKTALDKVSFEIGSGAIYGLAGSNGSGKSTILRLISGVYMPDGGTVTVDGEPVFNNSRAKSKIAYLGDTPYFLPHSTINEMAKFYGKIYPNFNYGIYNRLIEAFPLDYKARISTMSKGMQRQAALIMALSTSPQYLLLDEAFDGLDAVMRRVLKNILIEGADDRNMTTVIASHNLRELEDLCDHMGLIHKGRILFSDGTDKLKSNFHKVQAAFRKIPENTVFYKLDLVKLERSGSIISMVVKGNEEEIMSYINRLDPIFSECIEPSLEEMFVYELEVTGYDAKKLSE